MFGGAAPVWPLLPGLAVLAQPASAAWPRPGRLEVTPGIGFTFPQGCLNDAADRGWTWAQSVPRGGGHLGALTLGEEKSATERSVP